ncbi:MAG: histidine kinase dimerization/phospho-acceptor domain-containing protein, partial [Candidatus Gastranaerophilales bacterium]|nr:histidine kinase dimerization/phospho-acceptor domain-containing protein [Candidatus Gastranaerophilales bacterium]
MKNLKIVEQMLIVFVLSVFLPLIVMAFVVTNVNQHAVRKELTNLAGITAENVFYRLSKTLETKQMQLSYIAQHVSKIKNSNELSTYLGEIENKDRDINKIIVTNQPINDSKNIDYDNEKKELIFSLPIDNKRYFSEYVKIKNLEKDIFKFAEKNNRQIYVMDANKNIIISYNKDEKLLNSLFEFIPKNYEYNHPNFFGNIKNQPNVFIKLKEPDWFIIVATPEQATTYGIIEARSKIIWAILIAAFSTIFVGILYTFSLYTNIRQLFKAISAIGKGNYGRRIRVIKNIFTPHEIIFLSDEFNKMAEKIHSSYKEIEKNNKKLKKMDEYKSNLIDTVSHEFRTPLTSIKGYTSRLLRTDVQIDEETKIKSLKVIKNQSERLGR